MESQHGGGCQSHALLTWCSGASVRVEQIRPLPLALCQRKKHWGQSLNSLCFIIYLKKSERKRERSWTFLGVPQVFEWLPDCYHCAANITCQSVLVTHGILYHHINKDLVPPLSYTCMNRCIYLQ